MPAVAESTVETAGVMMAGSGAPGGPNEDEGKPAEGALATWEVCGYIADMCAEMMAMANASGHDALAYLLDMARYEADRLKREKR